MLQCSIVKVIFVSFKDTKKFVTIYAYMQWVNSNKLIFCKKQKLIPVKRIHFYQQRKSFPQILRFFWNRENF